jgi:hypothetical protein
VLVRYLQGLSEGLRTTKKFVGSHYLTVRFHGFLGCKLVELITADIVSLLQDLIRIADAAVLLPLKLPSFS